MPRPKVRRGPPSVNPNSPNNKGVGALGEPEGVGSTRENIENLRYKDRKMFSMRLPVHLMEEMAAHAYANELSAHEWLIRAIIKELAYEQAVDHILQQEGYQDKKVVLDPRPMAEELARMVSFPYEDILREENTVHE